MYCLVLTDTILYIFTKGKTYLVNQTRRHTKCLQHPCYDVGCYPGYVRIVEITKIALMYMMVS